MVKYARFWRLGIICLCVVFCPGLGSWVCYTTSSQRFTAGFYVRWSPAGNTTNLYLEKEGQFHNEGIIECTDDGPYFTAAFWSKDETCLMLLRNGGIGALYDFNQNKFVELDISTVWNQHGGWGRKIFDNNTPLFYRWPTIWEVRKFSGQPDTQFFW